jgi:thiol-disulfide isomerase/thioredoxin
VALSSALAVAVGCQSFGKKSEPSGANSTRPDPRNNDPFWVQNPPASRPSGPTVSVPAPPGPVPDAPVSGRPDEPTGIIAGRVVDLNSRPVPGAVIQVVPADGSSEPARDVDTSPQGHFMIRGLVPGRSYRVQARSKQDGRPMVGEVFAKPPDARVLVPVSAEFVTSSPSEKASPPAGGELGAPREGRGFFPPPAPESIAGIDAGAMPRANIPGFGLPETASTPPLETAHTFGPVPDCLISGGRIQTLRLSDPDGRTWDFSQRIGKVVLIDLWGTWCTPCLRAIPDLVRLQQMYRTRGLEVIGIACEKGRSGENLARVQKARRAMPTINYRLLLAGEPSSDPVRSQFQPQGYPCLILVDADGTIIWRGVGTDAVAEAESVIRRRLGGP